MEDMSCEVALAVEAFEIEVEINTDELTYVNPRTMVKCSSLAFFGMDFDRERVQYHAIAC